VVQFAQEANIAKGDWTRVSPVQKVDC